MPDTPRTRSELLALFASGKPGGITAQDARDLIVSSLLATEPGEDGLDSRYAPLDASLAIGNTVTGATAGSVLFAGALGVLAQNNAQLHWDDSSARLGIGTDAPSYPLHIVSPAPGNLAYFVDQNSAGVAVTTDSDGRVSLTGVGVNTGTNFGGAYFTADGYQEAWVNLHVASNASGAQWSRFGSKQNAFAIQTLNDAGTAIATTPVQVVLGAPDASLYVDATGKIGLGTSNPQNRLHIYGSVNGLHDFLVENASAGANAQARVTFKSSGTATAEIGLLGSGNTQLAPSTNALFLWNENASDTIFGLGNAERFRMKADGNFSIETAGTGVTLTTPDGAHTWRLTIDNAGAPVWTQIT